MTTTAAAHIITSDAEALGDPEILIMTVDEGMGAELIEKFEHGYDGVTAGDFRAILLAHEWRPTSNPTKVQPGYYIVYVEPA
jgi:hypothetical protein